MHEIDFSCKHSVLIENEDGTRQPMDQPYHKAALAAPHTWQVLSDGDFTYVVEGNEEALVIDSGYGAGNIRTFCQTLTDRPITRIANTHDHFDHTANNAYFDCAYMSAATYGRRTLPFPSFSGICFPRDYPVEIIDEGYVFHLGGRDLETYALQNHAIGSLAFLDRKNRILFSGDEIGMGTHYQCNYTVEHCAAYMKKIYDLRGAFDQLFAGGGIWGAEAVTRIYEALAYVLSHPSEGIPAAEPEPRPSVLPGDGAQVVYRRRMARPGDGPKRGPANPNLRELAYQGCRVVYDCTKVWERTPAQQS